MSSITEESFGIVPLKQMQEQWWTFLILHLQGEHWGFPKGKPLAGETAKESATRELLEETGLKVERFLQEEPFEEAYSFNRGKDRVEKKVYYFVALTQGEFSPQIEEVRDGKWVKLEEAEEALTFNESKNLCKKVKVLLSSF